jgi:hypothetical protein
MQKSTLKGTEVLSIEMDLGGSVIDRWGGGGLTSSFFFGLKANLQGFKTIFTILHNFIQD